MARALWSGSLSSKRACNGPSGAANGAAASGGGEKLQALSRDELYERAQEADIAGRSSMSKKQLVDALGDR